MSNQKLNVEDLIDYCRINWPREFQDAGATTVRLIRASDILLANGRKVMEQYGLTPAEFDTLATLRKMGVTNKLTPSDLCRANLLSSGGLTKILNHLEQRELISRRPNDADKRSSYISLTEKGCDLIDKSMGLVLQDHEEKLAAVYSLEEREELNRLLKKFHLAHTYCPDD
jgi:DNA-binding MarR family transcriptional regulator